MTLTSRSANDGPRSPGSDDELGALPRERRPRSAEPETAVDAAPKPPDDLKRITDEWRQTLDALTDLVILLDREGRILRINRTAEVWGLGPVRSLPERPFHEALHPRCDGSECYLLERWRLLREQLAEPQPPRGLVEREFEDRHLGRRLRVTVRPIQAEQGAAGDSRILLVLRDVTVYHHRQVTLTRRGQLEAMGHLVRGLAHEIGNPLAAVKTSIQVLVRNFDRFPRAKQETYLQRIVEGTDRIQAIIDRVLAEQQWKIERLQPVDVDALWRRLPDLFDDEVGERGIRLEVVAPEPPGLALLGDLAAVETVLAIVVGNAIEACERGGHVRVSAHGSAEQQVRLEVRDTGCGIRRGDLDRVFQPFFSTKSRGSGIGISHAHHLMEQMEGRIVIESTEGRGTIVALLLPPAPEARLP